MIKKLVMACVIILSASASAEVPIGTISAKGYPVTNGAELTGCSIEFNNTHSDRVYVPSKLIGVYGSITLTASERGAVYGLKVVVQDITMGPSGVTLIPNAPYDINLASSSGISTYDIKKTQVESTTPGGKFAVLPFVDKKIEKMMEEIAATQKAIILFNREKGGMDVRVPVDFTVSDTNSDGKPVRNNSAMQDYMKCQLQLFAKVREELRGKK